MAFSSTVLIMCVTALKANYVVTIQRVWVGVTVSGLWYLKKVNIFGK
jgi:hypothetical protein